MPYTEQQSAELTNRCHRSLRELQTVMLTGLSLVNATLPARANTYLQHGVGRRLEVLRKSLDQIFLLFPPSRTKPLPHELATEIQINLHAFAINVSGVFDSWAWAFVLRHNLLARLNNRRENVGMFKPRTLALLPPRLRDYLNSNEVSGWHEHYLKGYRDALAHRIPMYIPPATYTGPDADRFNELQREKQRLFQSRKWERLNEVWAEQDAIGTACYVFLHEYSADQDARPVLLHPQLLSDCATVVDFGNRFYEAWHEHA